MGSPRQSSLNRGGGGKSKRSGKRDKTHDWNDDAHHIGSDAPAPIAKKFVWDPDAPVVRSDRDEGANNEEELPALGFPEVRQGRVRGGRRVSRADRQSDHGALGTFAPHRGGGRGRRYRGAALGDGVAEEAGQVKEGRDYDGRIVSSAQMGRVINDTAAEREKLEKDLERLEAKEQRKKTKEESTHSKSKVKHIEHKLTNIYKQEKNLKQGLADLTDADNVIEENRHYSGDESDNAEEASDIEESDTDSDADEDGDLDALVAKAKSSAAEAEKSADEASDIEESETDSDADGDEDLSETSDIEESDTDSDAGEGGDLDALVAKAKSSAAKAEKDAHKAEELSTDSEEDADDATSTSVVDEADIMDDNDAEKTVGDLGQKDEDDKGGDSSNTPFASEDVDIRRGKKARMGNSNAAMMNPSLAASLADPNTTIAVTNSAGEKQTFKIGELGFDDLDANNLDIDSNKVHEFVKDGREYFKQFVQKGSEWVQQSVAVTSNVTANAKQTIDDVIDDIEDSTRSKTPIKVDLYVDMADPYSLELILGPVQHLLDMDLGPIEWRLLPHTNIGQERTKRVNCNPTAGHTTRMSCVANSVITCSSHTFAAMKSGLGHRRAVDPAMLGMSEHAGRFRRPVIHDEVSVDAGSHRARAMMMARLGAAAMEGGKVKRRGSHKAQGLGKSKGLGEDDDVENQELDVRRTYDSETEERAGADAHRILSNIATENEKRNTSSRLTTLSDNASSAQMKFVKCFATKLLELESTGAFGFNRKEDSVYKLSQDCCVTAQMTVAPNLGGGNVSICDVQDQCVRSDQGFNLMSKTSDQLHALKPKYKWLPWVVVEGKPACMHSCNLQKGIRRAVCNNREGTLPDDCPRFPWSKIWYDEPGVSFVGVAGVVIGLILTGASMMLLAQQAGVCGQRPKPNIGEDKPLLASSAGSTA